MRFLTALLTIDDLLEVRDELSDEIGDLAKAYAGLRVKAADFAPMPSHAAVATPAGEMPLDTDAISPPRSWC